MQSLAGENIVKHARIQGEEILGETELEPAAVSQPTYVPRARTEPQWAHHDVGFRVLESKEFIVHVDKSGMVDWETSDEYDAAMMGNRKYDANKRNSILNDVALLEATPCFEISEDIRQQFKRLLGEAIVCSLKFDYESGRQMIEAARTYLRTRSEETSRRWYLTASACTSVPFILIGILIWSCRNSFSEAFGDAALWLSMSVCAGAVGALFSVIARTGQLKFDCASGKNLHNLEGASRIGAGAISGLLVALAIRSGMILSPMTQGGRLHWIMLLAALVAGAGERMATSIISRIESSESKPQTGGEIAARGRTK